MCLVCKITLVFLLCSVVKSDYLVDTRKCKIANPPLFHEDVRSIYAKEDYTPCSNKTLLTYISTYSNFAVIYINSTAIKEYHDEEVNCCYQYVYRQGSYLEPDVGIRLSYCRPFNTLKIITKDTVKITCSLKNTTTPIYQNVHYFLQKIEKPNLAGNPISVLFIVVDSVSRLNFMRTMPLARNFLLDNNFIEMKGYNKIDDNTFPNFNALLTGLTLKQAKEKCKPYTLQGLNNCPMIWYDYRDLDYVTAYAEDWTSIGTFNYAMKGFKEPPTDHYFKPYFEASESLPGTQKDSMPFCTGPENAAERVLNLAKQFATTYIGKPSFGIFWMNTFSHNHINTPTAMDKTFKTFFEDLQQNHVLNDSIVVFLSDHGIRFGNIRQTRLGWLEERLPVNLISLPPWFKSKFPQETSNLITNSQGLTTTFDMHKTLQHLLILSGTNYTKTDNGHPQAISLLKEMPKERSCSEAGIPTTWCTCVGNLENMDPNSEYVKQATEIILNEVHLYQQYEKINITRVDVSEISWDGTRVMVVVADISISVYPQTYQGTFRLRDGKVSKLWVVPVYSFL